MTMEIIKLEPKASCEVDANAIAGSETFITAKDARVIYAQEREKERQKIAALVTANCGSPNLEEIAARMHRLLPPPRHSSGLKRLAQRLGLIGPPKTVPFASASPAPRHGSSPIGAIEDRPCA